MKVFYFITASMISLGSVYAGQIQKVSVSEHRLDTIARLGTILDAFERVYSKGIKKNIFPFVEYYHTKDILLLFPQQDILITEGRVIQCVQQLEKIGTSSPLRALYEYISALPEDADVKLERDFVLLLYCLYDHMTLSTLTKIEKSGVYTVRTDLYQAPLDQILAVLEILVSDLPLFIEQYECNSSLTWKQWKEKYWFFGSVAALMIIVKLAKAMRGSHTHSGDMPYMN